MMGTSHMASGAAVWLGGCALLAVDHVHPSLVHVVAGTAICAMAALWPDIDHESSRISRMFGILTLGLATGMRAFSRLMYRLTRTRQEPQAGGRHRGLTHTPLGALTFGALLAVGLHYLAHRWHPAAGWEWIAGPVTAGCLTHIFGDWLTKEGVPLAWPLSVGGRRWHHFRSPVHITTNKGPEHVLAFLFVGLAVVAGYITLT